MASSSDTWGPMPNAVGSGGVRCIKELHRWLKISNLGSKSFFWAFFVVGMKMSRYWGREGGTLSGGRTWAGPTLRTQWRSCPQRRSYEDEVRKAGSRSRERNLGVGETAGWSGTARCKDYLTKKLWRNGPKLPFPDQVFIPSTMSNHQQWCTSTYSVEDGGQE